MNEVDAMLEEVDAVLERRAQIKRGVSALMAEAENMLKAQNDELAQYGHTLQSLQECLLSSMSETQRKVVMQAAQEDEQALQQEIAKICGKEPPKPPAAAMPKRMGASRPKFV